MNDKFKDHIQSEEDPVARKLSQVAEGTQARSQFAAELEERLRAAHQPKGGWLLGFQQVSPALRWVALMILLAVVLSWSIRTLIPAPQPAVEETPITTDQPTPSPAPPILPDESATPETQAAGYNFRGAKLFLEEPLPESPATAHVYLQNREDIPATIEQARSLAERFGIQGETYTTTGLVFGTDDYLISDGKQSIQVHSEAYFSYSADMARSRRSYPRPTNPDAERIIRDFLAARGFDFPFRVYPSLSSNGYVVQLLAPDTIPMQYESFSTPMMRIVLDENGEVLTVDAVLMKYDETPVGEYGIITAQEALQRLLDDNVLAGQTEFVHSSSNMPDEWYPDYPDQQTITIYGYLFVDPAVDPAKPPLVLLNGVPLLGNLAGMEALNDYAFIKATGQFTDQNGVRSFHVESWDRKVQEEYLTGTLTRQGDRVIYVSDDGTGNQYPLVNPPADVPLDSNIPGSQLAISGVIANGQIHWTYIQYFESNEGGGGGGGGGLGFYKLNLNGPPVPFPSPSPRPPEGSPPTGIYTIQEGDTLTALAEQFGTTVDTLMQLNGLSDPNIFIGQTLVVPFPEPTERSLQDLRGNLSISDHKKLDGTITREYNLEVPQESGSSLYPLAGSMLNELDSYHALPVIVSGTLDLEGTLVVESYSIPYPDLRFQILRGTQREEQIGGQTVVIFTTEDGRSYVEYLASNPFPTGTFTGYQGDLIEQEVLIIPDETFGGLPVAHIYQSAIVQEGTQDMTVQSNRIPVYDEAFLPPDPSEFVRPNLTITSVELVYFGSNPYYQINDPNYSQRSPHIEPVWHFVGRYDDGTEFDVLIQALREEFLLPELAPGLGPG